MRAAKAGRACVCEGMRHRFFLWRREKAGRQQADIAFPEE